MKKVFIDTNVILDHVLQREHGAEVKAVVAWLTQNEIPMLMSVGGFYTMHYIIDKYLRQELMLDKKNRIAPLRTLLTSILQTFIVAEHDNASLLSGISNLLFSDLEDACQYELALRSDCDLLLTLDVKHYPQANDSLPVITPKQFIENYINKK